MQSDRVSFFPLTHDVETILNFAGLLKGQICSVKSYKEDDGKLRRTINNLHIDTLTTQGAGEIIIVPPDASIDKLLRYHEPILKAIKENKQVRLLQKHAAKLGIKGSCVRRLEKLPEHHSFQNNYRKHFEVPVPVFGVLSTEENCDKFLFQLCMQEYFNAQNVKTSFICSNQLGSLTGMYTIPEELFDNTYTFTQKVSYLNQYLCEVYFETKPDLMIVGVPGGVFSLQDNENDYFAEFAHLFSHAVKFDAISYNLFRNEVRLDETLDAIETYFAYAFKTAVYIFGISGMIAKRLNDSNEYEILKIQSYLTEKQLCSKRESGGWIVDTNDTQGLYHVLSKLLDEMQNGVHLL